MKINGNAIKKTNFFSSLFILPTTTHFLRITSTPFVIIFFIEHLILHLFHNIPVIPIIANVNQKNFQFLS